MSEAIEKLRLPELVQRAQGARKAGDLIIARNLAKELLERFPNSPHGYRVSAELEMAQRNFDSAESILTLAESIPADGDAKVALLILRATVAARRKDWADALRRWRAVLELKPTQPRAMAGLAEALDATGDPVAAEAMLSEANRAAPANLHVAMAWARAASCRGDWAAALFRWSQLREVYPENKHIYRQFGVARERFALQSALESDVTELDLAQDERGQIGPTANPELRDLMLNFENIGCNCEFGFVQRRFDAEPLGLLRWASTPYTSLIHLLGTRFANLGSSQTTKLTTSEWKEWILHDEESGISLHTYVRPETSAADLFLVKQLKGVRWLCEKLIDDLETGEKIFVYSAGSSPTSEEQMRQLQQLMRGYGPVTLLWVSVAAGQPPGSITVLTDGLLHGFIKRHGKLGAVDKDIVFDDWIKICRQARRYVQGQHSAIVRR